MSKPFSRTTTSPSASVLVCVTGQRDCDRLIRAGKELADQKGWPVQVLCVLPTAAAGQALCEELEYLRSTARDYQADMNIYFIAILVMLHFEQLLIRYGVKLAFAIAIPAACGIGILSILLKKDLLKGIAARVAVLGLAVALVVPCSTHITNYVAADLTTYVENTIVDTEDGADKLNEAMEGGTEEQTIFEKLSDLFQTAINDMSNLMSHFQNTIRKCMNSIAILILTNCLMPIINFFILKWILKETFHIALPMPQMRRNRHPDSGSGSGPNDSGSELLVVGE